MQDTHTQCAAHIKEFVVIWQNVLHSSLFLFHLGYLTFPPVTNSPNAPRPVREISALDHCAESTDWNLYTTPCPTKSLGSRVEARPSLSRRADKTRSEDRIAWARSCRAWGVSA